MEEVASLSDDLKVIASTYLNLPKALRIVIDDKCPCPTWQKELC